MITEVELDKVYPVTIVMDRYSGIYSGAGWTAWNLHADEMYQGPSESDTECMEFWKTYKGPVGKGRTPTEALMNLGGQLI